MLIMNEFVFFKCADVKNVKFLIHYNRFLSLAIFPENDNDVNNFVLFYSKQIIK